MNSLQLITTSADSGQEPAALSRRAAGFSVIVPVCVIIASALVGASQEGFGHPLSPAVVIIIGIASACLMVLGGLAASVALCRISVDHPKSVLVQGVVGLVVNCLLLFVFLANFARGFQNGARRVQARQRVEQAVQGVQDESRNALREGRSPENQGEKLDRVSRQFDHAAGDLSGKEALVLRGSAVFMKKLADLTKDYQKQLTVVENNHVLDVSDLHERSQLSARKDLVKEFVASNQRLKDFQSQGETNYRVELEKMGLGGPVVESALKGYRSRSETRMPYLLAMRDDDTHGANAMLGILDLLDETWGHWSYSTETRKIQFEDPGVLQKYNAWMTVIRAASAHQRAVMQEVAQLP